MKKTVNDRLIELQSVKKFQWNRLQLDLGISNQQQITNWITEKNREPIPPKHILKIIELFPDLNARWLITGEGNMLNDGMAVVNDPQPPYNTLESLKEKISSLEKDKEFLQQSLIEALRQRGGCPTGELTGGVESPGKTG